MHTPNRSRDLRTLLIQAAAVAALFAAALVGAGLLVKHNPMRCPTEDSPGRPVCVWVGPLDGNHDGPILINGPEQR